METSIIKRRELSLKAHLSLADQLLSPSEFLRQRFIEWGIAADKIAVMRNGIPDSLLQPGRMEASDRPRNRFAVFGNVPASLSDFRRQPSVQGLDVLLCDRLPVVVTELHLKVILGQPFGDIREELLVGLLDFVEKLFGLIDDLGLEIVS